MIMIMVKKIIIMIITVTVPRVSKPDLFGSSLLSHENETAYLAASLPLCWMNVPCAQNLIAFCQQALPSFLLSCENETACLAASLGSLLTANSTYLDSQ